MRNAWIVVAIIGGLLMAGSCGQPHKIELDSGMNTVVYPGETTNIEDAVDSIREDLQRVIFLDDSTWRIYRVSGPKGDLDGLVNGQTYYVYMSVARTWEIPRD